VHPQLQVAARRPAPHEPSVYGQELKKIRSRPPGGRSLNLTTANPPTRRFTKPILPATSLSKLAPLSSLATHL